MQTVSIQTEYYRFRNVRFQYSSSTAYELGNANPGGIFQTRVYASDGLQTRVPWYPGLIMIVSPAGGW